MRGRVHSRSTVRRAPQISPQLRVALYALVTLLLGCGHLLGQSAKPANQVEVQLPSPLTSVNRALPKWLRFSGEFRDRFEGRTAYAFRTGTDDSYDLTRLRLNLEFIPNKWLRGFVQAQDARALEINSSHVNSTLKDIFDLRQAYLEMKNGEHGHIILTVGRQEFNFGAQRLIGAFDWSNTARTFDAARVAFTSQKARVDVFASSVVTVRMTQFDNHLPGQNFYGVYGAFFKIIPKATFEPYLLWKTLPRVRSEAGVVGDADIYTAGTRLIGKLPAGFDYAIEMARQSGHESRDHVAAWAGYWIVGYALPKAVLKPRFSIEYDYASGDAGKGDGKAGTFDQLYPTNHAYYGIADQVGWRNIRDLRVGTDVQPMRKLKANFDWHFFRLASAHDGLYNAGGALVVAPPAAGAVHRDVGHEVDIYFSYSPREQVSLGAGFGHMFPGQFLKDNSPGSGTSFPYAFLTYRF